MEEPKSYSIEKLNESNYCSWSQAIESHLDDQDIWGIVNGTDTQPLSPTVLADIQTAEEAQEYSMAMAEYETRMEE